TDPEKLVDFLNRHKADLLDITPSFLQVLLLHLEESGSKWNVKYVLAAGEALTAGTCNLLRDARLFNLYGPTEACVYATAEEVNLPVQQYNSIGKPLRNTKLHVLNTQLNEAGIGVWGELFISGAGLAEYWQRDELNKERFIQHKRLGRLYRTGDLGRWNHEGIIEFRGRTDGQVKVRGFRIELGEVEQAIRSFDGISDAAVIYNATEKQLVAFAACAEPRQDELRKYLQDRLPAYMMPALIIALPSLPVTGSGKIDRAMLQQQSLQVKQPALYQAASTHTEQKLLSIWKEILPLTAGVNDDFFELGGHSLKAMRMVSAIYRELSYKLNLRDVFTNRTVQQLAKYIDSQSSETFNSIQRIAASGYYSISPGQREIWLAAQQEGGVQAYNMVMQFSWKQSFNADAYQTAWKQLLQRHEILRTVFILNEGEVVQQVLPEINSAIEIILDANPDEISAKQKSLVFDLSSGPLIKTCVAQLSPLNTEIFITIHHIIADAWSFKIIARDLQELYNACIHEREPQLPELPIQYK
ncbi:MAG TPA: condensation domain-containing protein, partial [Ferruginibacter sp.]|nr:condensation domain-containing protein [Ferruginibacter sp.]